MMKIVAALLLAHVQFFSCQVKASAHNVLRGGGQTDCTCVPSSNLLQTLAEKLADIMASATTVPQCGPGTWKKLISLDMSDSSQQCPSGWQQYSSPVRSCGRPAGSSAGCNQVTLPVGGTYSKVCGKAVARAGGTPDAFMTFGPRDDENYVDGLSVTHSSPRQHIWTFAADQTTYFRCPCNGHSSLPPSFVGSNYFCDASGNGDLWDGEGCVTGLSCCSFNSPPWFSTQLPAPTSDNVDVRICADELISNENVHVEVLELYVQ